MTRVHVPGARSRRAPARGAAAHLLGLGLATPAAEASQAEMAHRLAELWSLDGEALDRWHRIVEGTRIDRRAIVQPVERVIDLSTAARMALFEREAPNLAARAAHAALDRCGVPSSAVTDLVVVTCTGFAAPGVDVSLVDALGLRPTVRRMQVGFMGCFGAITGLRAAAGTACADPRAVVLVVCVELCTLHLRRDRAPGNLVATALFGDGAAAAIVAGNAAEPVRDAAATSMGRVSLGSSALLPGRRDRMTWRITDAGFAMTLGREVPALLRDRLPSMVGPFDPARRRVAVHPGGAAVLDAVGAGLGLDTDASGSDRSGLDAARDVLRRHGNMSSPSVLFVLDRVRAADPDRPVTLMAFGPGLTMEMLEIGARPGRSRSDR